MVAVLGVGAAFGLGAFDEDEAAETTEAVVVETSTSDGGTTPGSVPTTTIQGEDPLCLAHADLVAALDGHLPSAGPDDVQAVRSAGLAFYTEAVDYVDAPERDAFDTVLAYEQETYDYAEDNEWNPSRPLQDLVDNPPPTVPGDAWAVVRRVLEERCGVVAIVE
ncbi:MAG: hypothetical protein ACRDZM_05745 [Acidimicrobiia bacterium]